MTLELTGDQATSQYRKVLVVTSEEEQRLITNALAIAGTLNDAVE